MHRSVTQKFRIIVTDVMTDIAYSKYLITGATNPTSIGYVTALHLIRYRRSGHRTNTNHDSCFTILRYYVGLSFYIICCSYVVIKVRSWRVLKYVIENMICHIQTVNKASFSDSQQSTHVMRPILTTTTNINSNDCDEEYLTQTGDTWFGSWYFIHSNCRYYKVLRYKTTKPS